MSLLSIVGSVCFVLIALFLAGVWWRDRRREYRRGMMTVRRLRR